MRNNEFLRLARLVREKTKRNAINWVPGSVVNSYQSSLGKGGILIIYDEEEFPLPDGSFNPLIQLSFLNERGDFIGSVNCETIKDENYELLKEIYDSAENTYKKIDETIKSMYDDLLAP